VKKLFAQKNIILTIVIVINLVTAFGCSSKDNVRYDAYNGVSSDGKSEAIKKDKYRTGYQERYQDFY